MKWNKLLERQIYKHLSETLVLEESIQPFLNAINNSYTSYERDHGMAERSLIISEEEFVLVNEQLKDELSLKKLSIERLKEAIIDMAEEGLTLDSDNLLDIVGFLKVQVRKRKEAENTLTTTANRLSYFISNMQSGILVEDEHHRIVLTNQFFCKISGFRLPPEMIIGRECTDGFIKQSRTFHDRVNQLVKEKKTVVNEELQLENGRIYERDYIPIFINNVYHGHLWNYKDITDRKKAEKKLKASEELWHFALEGAGDGVWEYNIQTKEVFFSRQYKKMLGYEDNEFENTKQNWLKNINPEDYHLVAETDEAYLSQSIISHQREYRIRHKNGHYIWILDRGMVISHTSDGIPERIVGTHADITERKLSEQTLLIREEKYRNIIANMNLGLTEIDNEGIIQYANHLFCKMSGYELDELLGKNADVLLFTSPQNSALIREKGKLRKKGISDAYEMEIRNREGDLKWWLISGAPRYNDSAKLVGSIGIYLDFTDRKKLEFDLYEAREQAELSGRAKESFLANMSHEIRTPMNAILGMSHQLEKTLLNDSQSQFLSTILTAADHLMVVINDILDMSKIEAGMLSLEYIGFNLESLINHTQQVISSRADEKGIELKVDIQQGISPVLLGDPHRLNQILLNLMSNAVKFTEKGSVSLSCTLQESTSGWQSVHICITDTGIGMDEVFLSNMFEKFVQEDKSIARKYGGTGLGMAITRQLIDLMSGSIHVQSKKGKGTEVSIIIKFPIGVATDLPKKQEALTNTSVLNGLRVLLVEDYEFNRFLMKEVLKQYNVCLVEAPNGAEAIKLLCQQKFDLILMDIQMPVMSGMEAITIIREELKMDIPVIALTANAIKGENKRCLEAGMNAYVSKPFEEAELVNAITGCISDTHHNNIQAALNPSPVLPQKSLYSTSAFKTLAKGNTLIIKGIIDMVLIELPLSVKAIRDAYIDNDFNMISELMHSIKPTILSLKIDSLNDTVKALENLKAQLPSKATIQLLVEKLESVLSEVLIQLREDLINLK